MKSIFVPSLAFITALLLSSCSENPKPLKALIIDGQNNHTIWPTSTAMMKHYLEETGLFEVDVARTQYTWKGEEHLANYSIPGLPQTEALDEPKPMQTRSLKKNRRLVT